MAAAAAAAGDAPRKKSLEEIRSDSAVSMEDFIKRTMMVILQPFINHVQSLDERLHQLSEHLAETDGSLDDTNAKLDEAKAALDDLKDGIIGRTNTRVQKLQDALDRCERSQGLLHESHEHTRGHIEVLQAHHAAQLGQQPQLERTLLRLEEGLQACQLASERTNDDLEKNVKHGISQLACSIQDLRAKEGQSSNDLRQLQADVAQKGQLLLDTREVLDKTSAAAAKLQRNFQDMQQREAQMGARVEGWKHHWDKMYPALDSLRKETAALKQRSDHCEAVVHSLQQGYATTFSSIEAVDVKHCKLRDEVTTVKESLVAAHKGLEETRDGLGKATSFSNNLHGVLERTAADLGRAAQKLDGLESRHTSLQQHVEKTSGGLADLVRDHRASTVEVQGLQQDLQKANDGFSHMRSQLEATNSNIHGVRSELGRTNEAVQRLDHGVELCHAGFSGLQKGFAETGNHMSSRPMTLPKLPSGPPGVAMRSPRHMSTSSTMTTSSSSSWSSS